MEKLFRWVLAVIKTSIDNTRLIFIPGIHSLTNTKVKEFIHSRSKKFKNNILSVKRITKFNDSFFKIKVYSLNFNLKKFVKYLKK